MGPSLRTFLDNFATYDASLGKKPRKALRSNVKKVVTLSPCCGHHGEPGC